MSFLGKLKSVFIEPEKSGESTKEVKEFDQKLQTSNQQSSQVPTEVQFESIDKFAEILNQILEKNNQQGFDYLEYKKAIQSIGKLHNMEEGTQYKTAFAAATAMNVQPAHLLDSARKYLMLLENELTKFNQAAGQYMQSQVGIREQETGKLSQAIEQKTKQLNQIQSELEQHHKRLNEITSEISLIKTKVNRNKDSFKQAYDQLVGQISSDIQKMEQYLK